jgi:hypothetical protein
MANDSAVVQQHASAAEMKEVRLSDTVSLVYEGREGREDHEDRTHLAIQPEAGYFRAIAHLNPPTVVRSAE